MNSKLKSVKEMLKAYANFLKHYKLAFKEDQRNVFLDRGWYDYPHAAREKASGKYDPTGQFTSSRDYRHRHVAYCLLRGKTLRQIESNIGHIETVPKYSEQWYRLWYNRLDMKLVKKYYDTFKSIDYPEFPDDITYDSKLTKVEGWVVKEAVGE